jgi:hypothetical protein
MRVLFFKYKRQNRFDGAYALEKMSNIVFGPETKQTSETLVARAQMLTTAIADTRCQRSQDDYTQTNRPRDSLQPRARDRGAARNRSRHHVENIRIRTRMQGDTNVDARSNDRGGVAGFRRRFGACGRVAKEVLGISSRVGQECGTSRSTGRARANLVRKQVYAKTVDRADRREVRRDDESLARVDYACCRQKADSRRRHRSACL